MSKINLDDQPLSPATRAFVAIGLLIIIIVILIWPPATWAVLSIAGAIPTLLNAVAAFIVALNSKPVQTVDGRKSQ
jgi:hypothetical protein